MLEVHPRTLRIYEQEGVPETLTFEEESQGCG
jgi:DNA-binding transcriptional MerR regulator